MQRSAARPTGSASARVRPLSSRTRWKARGPSPGCTPVQIEVYGFIRSPVDERGNSCSITSRSRNAGTTFSMPITVTSTSGSVVHIRPLPSDSTTATLPVSAHAKFAPEIATRAPRNASRRNARAAAVSSPGSVAEGREAEPLAEEVADLGPVLVDRRDEEVRGPLARELDDQLGEIGLERVDARAGERLVEPDLVGRERLHLDDLVRALVADELRHERVRLRGVARPVDDAAARRHGGLEVDEQPVERAERVVLDRGAGVAELLPVGHLGDRLRPLRADRRRRVQHVGANLPVRERLARAARERLGGRPRGRLAHDARTSARCTARTGEPRRRRPPPMCSRQEASHAHTASAPLARTLSSFASSIAAETSAFLTAKVPPKPQHSSASGQRRRARGRRRRGGGESGRSPRRRSRSE